MSAGLQTIIYPVKDLTGAKAVFGALLGVEPYADTPYYVGYKAAGQDVGLDPNGHGKGMTGPVPYWHVTDLRERLAALLDAGAELLQDAQDVGNGRLIASVKDADGNLVGLLQDPLA
ncbi:MULTISPECIES: VOC family protein [unclassified Streptomyces]|uniref:VOC family protein n=1 Tax=unclassified Streptomyces TaxID=2593676 RepID=UPI000DDB076A|nr:MULTISPECIES: glyoxalase [unclassified Streptomyces]QZZ31671.1 glyoxalase [Streptomyces sp. ST1015]